MTIHTRRCLLRLVLLTYIALCALQPQTSHAGQYRVDWCQAEADEMGRPIDNATETMRVDRVCDTQRSDVRRVLLTSLAGFSHPRGSTAATTIKAPRNTDITYYQLAGYLRRHDCRWDLRIYAIQYGRPKPIVQLPARRTCPRRYIPHRRFSTEEHATGITHIVARIQCLAARVCSDRGRSYILVRIAKITISDAEPPQISVHPEGRFGKDVWLRSNEDLPYTASDNAGISSVEALLGGRHVATVYNQCRLAHPDGKLPDLFQLPMPCGSTGRQSGYATIPAKQLMQEGTQQIVLRARDISGEVRTSDHVIGRFDFAAPPIVTVLPDEKGEWRRTNHFGVQWENPIEADRAPIVAAKFKLCPAGGGACVDGERRGNDIAGLGLSVPGPGTWTLAIWRRDAAGNESEAFASAPVSLRYDPEAPVLRFAPPAASDPTLVSVAVTDAISGVRSGTIEIAEAASGDWRPLATHLEGASLVARIDDAAWSPGEYVLRATAVDLAGNQTTSNERTDGQLAALTLPLRLVARLQSGVLRHRVERSLERIGRKRRWVVRRVTELSPFDTVKLGDTVEIAGRLATVDGRPLSEQAITVLSRSLPGTETPVDAIRTDADGRFRYTSRATMSHRLRFVFAGSALVIPAHSEVSIGVTAATSLRVNRMRVRNGRDVTFRGQLRTLPVADGGKLIELQVLLSRRWQTFRTTRADQTGRWHVGYQFKRTTHDTKFRFRARVPKEAGYPFEPGTSGSVVVAVRGAR